LPLSGVLANKLRAAWVLNFSAVMGYLAAGFISEEIEDCCDNSGKTSWRKRQKQSNLIQMYRYTNQPTIFSAYMLIIEEKVSSKLIENIIKTI
jgi:hypothetical protein